MSYPIVQSILLGSDNIIAKVGSSDGPISTISWLQLWRAEDTSLLGGLTILASEQQLLAILGALRTWHEAKELSSQTAPSTFPPPSSGPLSSK